VAGAAITGTATVGTADMKLDTRADMEVDTAMEAGMEVEVGMAVATDTFSSSDSIRPLPFFFESIQRD
jgi:hypothetical protein